METSKSTLAEAASPGVVTIRVIVADNRQVIRTSLERSLSDASDIEVVAEAADLAQLQSAADRLNPGVVLAGVALLAPRWSEPAARFGGWKVPSPILLIMPEAQDGYLALAVELGAAGYVLEDADFSRIESMVRRVAAGETFWNDKDLLRARRWNEDVYLPWQRLTDRERDVLALLAIGTDNTAIASTLAVSVKTVEHHVSSILQKLGLASRLQAAVWFLEEVPPSLRGRPRL